MKKHGLIFITLLLVNFGSLEAASFNCGKATSIVEKTICSNEELSKLDDSLNKAYREALERPNRKQQIIKSQRQWLKFERNKCQDIECIKKAYEDRIRELHFSASWGIVFFRDPNQKIPAPIPTGNKSELPIVKPQVAAIPNMSGEQRKSTSAAISVSGTSDPWLAGMPDGSTASSVDTAPNQSPVVVTGIDQIQGGFLTFNVSGGVYNTTGCPSSCDPLDGGSFHSHDNGAENGISDVNAPMNALVGVFLDDNQPNTSPAPPELDFSKIGLSFSSLSPALKQVFFIGDGLTGTKAGSMQTFVIPAGATRLFLGTMDSWEWSDNSGSLTVRVTLKTNPNQKLSTSKPQDKVVELPVESFQNKSVTHYIKTTSSVNKTPQNLGDLTSEVKAPTLARSTITSGKKIARPRLMSEVLYADKFYTEPPSDGLVWSKVLLDLKVPGFSPRVDTSSAWRGCNYKSALATLSEIQSQLGKESSYLKIWAANQDRVFLACEGQSGSDNPPILPNGKLLPKRAQGDFLYQLGSWNFYRGDYKEALTNYEQAEKLIGTPQRANAAYMVVRTLAYLNRAEDAYHKIGKILLDPSLHTIHESAKNYRFVIMSNSRSFNLALTPELAMEHLNWLQKIVQINTKKTQQPERAFAEQKDAFEQLNVYFPLYAPDSKALDWWLSDYKPEGPRMRAVKALASKIPLIDWMQAKWAYNVFDYDWLWALHDKDNPYWEQNRHIVIHALEQWKNKNDGVWLQIAIRRVHPQDKMAQQILAAAEPFLCRPWKTETPEYRLWLFDLWTHAIRIHLGRGETDKVDALVSGHFDYYGLLSFPESRDYSYYRNDSKEVLDKTLRWLIYTGQIEHARSFLNIVQKQFKNEFYQWRSLLAVNLDEALSVAIAEHAYYSNNFGNEEVVWREMLNMLPSHELYSLASDDRIKQGYRALMARTLFTRAILLHYDNEQLDRYAALAAKLNPEIREQVLENAASHNRDKYIGFLLRMPRFRPAVYLEYADVPSLPRWGDDKVPAIGAIDRYNHNDNNWWCRFDSEMLQKRIFDAMKIIPRDNDLFTFQAPVQEMDQEYNVKSKQTINKELKPYLENQRRLLAGHPYSLLIDRREIETLENIPSGPQYLSEAVINRELGSRPAASLEEQNERAANLHRAVRTTRYGCNRDGSHAEYSEQAYKLLHERYENTPWAKATPYWFE